jgi:hypothetical protein
MAIGCQSSISEEACLIMRWNVKDEFRGTSRKVYAQKV